MSLKFAQWDHGMFVFSRCEDCHQPDMVINIEGCPKICRKCVEARRQAREVEAQLHEFFHDEPQRGKPIKSVQDLHTIRAGLVAVNCPRPLFVTINHEDMMNIYNDPVFQRTMQNVAAKDQVETLKALRIDATKHVVLALLFGDLYVVLRLPP